MTLLIISCIMSITSTILSDLWSLKGRVHCFLMQVLKNKRFLLNSEKNYGADPSCRFREKCKNAPLIPKNDFTEPKARKPGYSNY